ncbi:7,8 dihydropteroate synthase (methanopterin) [hydrocarbon metagenome]|uniref:7,8 dihydropteroate synthase (Methanopterin) n=1 Tax=hydrocarbon metagenome TaxID=938273 RepID=A0A0W8FDA5_9ZZZZ
MDLLDLDYVVLSHGHLDHTRGFVHLVNILTEARLEGRPHTVPRLIADPYCFYPRSRLPVPDSGGFLSREALARHMPNRADAKAQVADGEPGIPRWDSKNARFRAEGSRSEENRDA